jgi:DNA-directed RNA polymerase alpha subunit
MLKGDFFPNLSAPARRALENAGIDNLKQLSKLTEDELLTLHGMGPSTLPKLRQALKAVRLSFKKK